MTAPTPQMLEVGKGSDLRRVACLCDPPRLASGASLFWLSGFKSDMVSTKATVVAEHAHERGLGCMRFDYSGHGASGGRFVGGTIGRWAEDAARVVTVALGREPHATNADGVHIAEIQNAKFKMQKRLGIEGAKNGRLIIVCILPLAL